MTPNFPDRLLRAYKRWISPALPPSCRFVPTCSEYAAQAVAQRGPFMGSLFALWRLMRCNPLVRGGYDPVPSTLKTDPSAAQCGHRARS
jgi:putative membrane protein insertion efficiency factor